MNTRILRTFLLLCLLFGPQLTYAKESTESETLQGYFIKRSDNTYLHVEMVGIQMIFKLLDKDHHEIENVFTRGVMTVNPKGKSSIRMVIQPTGDGISLKSSKLIKKPHLLKINGRLFKGEDDTVGEAFNIQYNQHTVDEVTVTPLPKS
jgi:hypothetical protein